MVRCANPNCFCDSSDGDPLTFCSQKCRKGVACASRVHVQEDPPLPVSWRHETVATIHPSPLPRRESNAESMPPSLFAGTQAESPYPQHHHAYHAYQHHNYHHHLHQHYAPRPCDPIRSTPPARCFRRECPCDSGDGREGGFCSFTCQSGTPCRAATHLLAPAMRTTSLQTIVQAPQLPAPSTTPRCARRGCLCDSWNGTEGQFCHRSCQAGQLCSGRAHVLSATGPEAALQVRCNGFGCPCDSFSGQPGDYCCKTCKAGTICSHRFHTLGSGGANTQQMSTTTPSPQVAPARCARTGCSCDSFNGQLGQHCCRTCHAGTPCTTRTHVFAGVVTPSVATTKSTCLAQ